MGVILVSMRRWAERVADSRMGKLVYLFVGQPPPKGSPMIDQLVWVRRFYTRPLPVVLILYVFVLTALPSPLNWAVLAFGVATWLGGLVSLSLKIRRERAKG
jgi:hypothetical protein